MSPPGGGADCYWVPATFCYVHGDYVTPPAMAQTATGFDAMIGQ
jgi:hypothetical protein